MTLVIAHRGASLAEPENTLAAFRRAGAMGADGVELDVRRTADDRLVVHHDPVVSGGRVIRETAAADLPPELPELGAALDACAGLFVNIEIKNEKTEPDFDPSEWVARRVAIELLGRGHPTRWLVSSFRIETVDTFRRLAPGIRTAWLVYGPTPEVLERAAASNHVAVHPSVEFVTEQAVRAAHALGLAVNTWTCDDPIRMRELMAWGVDGICTNVPDVALVARAGRSA
jgi:glycerophosphoryl diester phosphodiesterase